MSLEQPLVAVINASSSANLLIHLYRNRRKRSGDSGGETGYSDALDPEGTSEPHEYCNQVSFIQRRLGHIYDSLAARRPVTWHK